MQAIKKFAGAHPQLTSWIVLAIGMVIILVWSAWDVGFTSTQWAALIVTTILLAGACVWIIGWEDDEDEPLAEPESPTANQAGLAESNQAEQ
jgi:MFS superfamily sulfate permease-like transporter